MKNKFFNTLASLLFSISDTLYNFSNVLLSASIKLRVKYNQEFAKAFNMPQNTLDQFLVNISKDVETKEEEIKNPLPGAFYVSKKGTS
jgi:hypothetical protein